MHVGRGSNPGKTPHSRVGFRYLCLKPSEYVQYETSRKGIPATTSRVFKRPVWGFSIGHPFGCKCLIISKVRATILSASTRFLGVFAVVRAMEYCWHGGEAHTNS